MKIRECMTSKVTTVQQTDTVQKAAQLMRDAHVGFLPVVNLGGAPIGVVTDRDLALRVLAEGLPPAQKVSTVMSETLHRVDEEQPVDEAVALMKDRNIGRLIVTNALNQVVGVFSLGDAAVALGDHVVGNAVMEAVGRHKQPVAGTQSILQA
jgi:CBS domain-containing protein